MHYDKDGSSPTNATWLDRRLPLKVAFDNTIGAAPSACGKHLL
jgi:hypothetical protein